MSYILFRFNFYKKNLIPDTILETEAASSNPKNLKKIQKKGKLGFTSCYKNSVL